MCVKNGLVFLPDSDVPTAAHPPHLVHRHQQAPDAQKVEGSALRHKKLKAVP